MISAPVAAPIWEYFRSTNHIGANIQSASIVRFYRPSSMSEIMLTIRTDHSVKTVRVIYILSLHLHSAKDYVALYYLVLLIVKKSKLIAAT
jgi:hypothetical protein